MASEKILEGKKAKVAALTEMLQDSVSFVLVDYKGISVEDDTKLRKELREAGVHYVVEKNSMLRFAFKNMGIDAFDEVLHGTTAVALSKDDQIIGYQFVSLGKMTDFIKKGDDPNTAWEKAQGQYGRVADAVKIIDPRKE